MPEKYYKQVYYDRDIYIQFAYSGDANEYATLKYSDRMPEEGEYQTVEAGKLAFVNLERIAGENIWRGSIDYPFSVPDDLEKAIPIDMCFGNCPPYMKECDNKTPDCDENSGELVCLD